MATENLDHNATVFRRQYFNGAMNGFVSAHRETGKDGTLAMGYYDGEDLPVYWNLADGNVLFERFFSSAAGGSIRNYMFWVTASPGARATSSHRRVGESLRSSIVWRNVASAGNSTSRTTIPQ
jgi:phospholipase C